MVVIYNYRKFILLKDRINISNAHEFGIRLTFCRRKKFVFNDIVFDSIDIVFEIVFEKNSVKYQVSG